MSGPTDNLQHASENPQNNKIIQHRSKESSPDHKEKRLRGTKRKGPDDANPLKACSKRLKISQSVVSGVNNHLPPGVLVPIGTQWQHNSCTYDAICTVLFNVWREDPAEMTLSWNELNNDILNSFTASFELHVENSTGPASYSLEQIRDQFRYKLARMDDEFAFGRYASVHTIINRLLVSWEPVTRSVRRCHADHAMDSDERDSHSCKIPIMGDSTPIRYSIQEYIEDFSVPLSVTCIECSNKLVRSFSFVCHPPLLCIELWHRPRLLDPVLHIDAGGFRRQYNLRGVIYFLGKHFTSRFIARNGMVWFHDGLLTGSSLIYMSSDISSIPIEESTLAIYIRC